ncbi:membrane hypothetical protein [Candidatus Zixiibacteriota bacterium]|nr:membrane hypothetical protein [candidate division Zixibacteria bacterium]
MTRRPASYILSGAIVYILVIFPALVFGTASQKKNGMFGIKFGAISWGPVNVKGNNIDIDSRAKYSYGIFLDFPLVKKLSAGVAFDIYRIVARFPEIDVEFIRPTDALDASLAVKFNFESHENPFVFRPALAVGYGMFNSYNYSWIGKTRYMTLKAYLEVLALSGISSGICAEAGLLYAVGHTEKYHFTAGPMIIVRGGITL